MTNNQKKSTPRGKGRPTEDTSVGRNALIAATEELLRKSPPDRLTVVEIAKHAGVTPALIRYYFGNKESLLMETALLQLDNLQLRGKAVVESDSSLPQRLSDRLGSMIDQVQTNPRFHQLIMDTVYTGSSQNSDELIKKAATRGLSLTQSLLQDTREEELREIDPRYLHVAIIGMTEFFGSADTFLRQLFGPDAIPDETRSGYVAFITDVLLNGIRKR